MSVRALLRECVTDLLDTEPSVTVEQVVACAYRNHRDEFEADAERMVLQSARSIVAQMMRDFTEDDDEQLTLPGFGLPSAICVQSPNGTYYVRSDKATWAELLAGRQVRADNVTAAQRKLDRYDDALDMLRPLMEAHPTVTVADAVSARAQGLPS